VPAVFGPTPEHEIGSLLASTGPPAAAQDVPKNADVTKLALDLIAWPELDVLFAGPGVRSLLPYCRYRSDPNVCRLDLACRVNSPREEQGKEDDR
jgi:hypothetical protein